MATAASKRQRQPNISSPHVPVLETQNIPLTIDPSQIFPSTLYVPPVTETSQIFPDTPYNSTTFPFKNIISEPALSQSMIPRQLSPLHKSLLSSFSVLEIPTDNYKPIIIPGRKNPRKNPTRGFTFHEKDNSGTSHYSTFQSKIKISEQPLPPLSDDIPSADSCKYMIKGADYYYNLVMFMLSDDNKLGEIIRECKERDEALINGTRNL